MNPLFRRIESFPPVLCRLLAHRYPPGQTRRWPVALTDEEVIQNSGGALTLADVRHLSLLLSWSDVPLNKVQAFIVGCRLNLGNRRAYDRIVKMRDRAQFLHVRRSPEWNGRFKELVEIWEGVKHVA